MQCSPNQLHKVPDSPGVYLFKDHAGQVIYIGKSINLKKRVRQYFTESDVPFDKTKILIAQIYSIRIIQTTSEFDALLLESNLIRRYQPKYNIISKDDKSRLYVCLTMSLKLPRILLLRKSQLRQLNTKDKLFGPFQSGNIARQLLRTTRTAIPFCTQKVRNGAACFYTHLGLCNPCPSLIEKLPTTQERKLLTAAYRRNISRICNVLSGKSSTVLRQLEKEMEHEAKALHFEQANVLKIQIANLINLTTKSDRSALYMDLLPDVSDIHTKELTELQHILFPYYPNISNLHRIECIDIANLSGTHATGSLVVLTDSQIDTDQYRRFRIKTKEAYDDAAMMREVLCRRFNHTEWQYPDLLLVDGGKPQIKSALKSLAFHHISIPVIGLTKRHEEIIVPLDSSFRTIRLSLTSPTLLLLERIRDEAHRFARRYHHDLRMRYLLPKLR